MKITEEEAETKWCIRTVDNDPKPSFCAALKCMAWRWVESEFMPDGNTYRQNRRGYCGLAGEPKS